MRERKEQDTVETISAYFDGKVIIPDEPLDLPPNHALILQILAVGGTDVAAEESSLAWIAANAVDSDALPVDLAETNNDSDHIVRGHRILDCPLQQADQYHARAIAWHAAVLRSGSTILTTEAVLWEWPNALADTTRRATAAEGYRRNHADKHVEVVPFDVDLDAAAVDLYRSRGDKLVMKRRRLAAALTTDHHFEQAGMKALMLSLPSP